MQTTALSRIEADLAYKTVVITGGGRGIGRETAVTLAASGAVVVIISRTAEEIEETASHIRQRGGQAVAFTADVGDWLAMQMLAARIAEEFGAPHVVVANAGILEPVGKSWEVDVSEWAKNLTVNLTGAFYTTRAFLPMMVEGERGRLIFVSSGAAGHAVPGWSAYGSAKAGLDHFARHVAAELDQMGSPIRVHTVYPGVVDTDMQQRIRQMPSERFPSVDRYQAYKEKGILRPPEEPARLILWLATSLADDWHGRVASIDDPEIQSRLSGDLGVFEIDLERSKA